MRSVFRYSLLWLRSASDTIWSSSKQSSFVMWDFGFDLMYAYASRKQVSNLSSAIFYSHRSYVIRIVAMTFAQPSSELRFVWKVSFLCLFILKDDSCRLCAGFCLGGSNFISATFLFDKYFVWYEKRFVFIRQNIVSSEIGYVS